MFIALIFLLKKMIYYKVHYSILEKQQQYYVNQSHYLIKRNEQMMKSIDLEQHKIAGVRYENIGIMRKRSTTKFVTPQYLEWLCGIATCKQRPSSSS
jgi:hypothetical protein